MTAAFLACCCFALACNRGAPDVAVVWKTEPAPPVAGTPTLVRVIVARADGGSAAGARLRLEAHMTHPGMAPVVTDLSDRSNGVYEARLQLSMPGDWIFVVSGALADGSRITRETRLAAVAPGR